MDSEQTGSDAAAAALRYAQLSYDRAYSLAQRLPRSRDYQAALADREGELQQAYRDAGIVPPCVWTRPVPEPEAEGEYEPEL